MTQSITILNEILLKLGSVACPVIQENMRLSFEDDLRSEGLLYCLTVNQHLHWACWQYGELLEKEKFELLNTSSSSKNSWRAVVGYSGEWANKQTKKILLSNNFWKDGLDALLEFSLELWTICALNFSIFLTVYNQYPFSFLTVCLCAWKNAT